MPVDAVWMGEERTVDIGCTGAWVTKDENKFSWLLKKFFLDFFKSWEQELIED